MRARRVTGSSLSGAECADGPRRGPYRERGRTPPGRPAPDEEHTRAKVTHFEIPADDPERAMTFDSDVLGWTFPPWRGIGDWLAQTGPDDEVGILGAIVRRESPFDGDGVAAYVCTMNVDDLDARLARVPELGGTVVNPKRAVDGMGWHA